jgi:hypothetical protein
LSSASQPAKKWLNERKEIRKSRKLEQSLNRKNRLTEADKSNKLPRVLKSKSLFALVSLDSGGLLTAGDGSPSMRFSVAFPDPELV